MRKVYIVTSGDYSDYRINAVFSTLELAEEYEKLASHRNSNGVNEWEMDVDFPELRDKTPIFHVVMLRDGATLSVDELPVNEFNADALKRSPRLGSPSALGERGWPEKRKEKALRGSFRAKDAEHAVKIANEHRTRMIAAGEWDE